MLMLALPTIGLLALRCVDALAPLFILLFNFFDTLIGTPTLAPCRSLFEDKANFSDIFMGTDRLLTRPKGAHMRPLTSQFLRYRHTPSHGALHQ